MKLVSWNVNGIRAVLKKGFLDFVKKEQPDVLCLQETKTKAGQVGLDGYKQYWNAAQRAGYASTAVFTRIAPIKLSYGMGKPEHDAEGRIIVLEYERFQLVNVYTPNSGRGLPRHNYRQQWDRDFLGFIVGLEKSKPVIICGDMNVAHEEMDLARPKQNRENAGFTPEEREGFTRLLDAGFIDSFRELHKEPGNYTWWSYMFNARQKNIGWRVDYFVISKKLRPILEEAFIMKELMGSDHCPVGIKLDI